MKICVLRTNKPLKNRKLPLIKSLLSYRQVMLKPWNKWLKPRK